MQLFRFLWLTLAASLVVVFVSSVPDSRAQPEQDLEATISALQTQVAGLSTQVVSEAGTQSQTPAPVTETETLLYEADWSDGLDGWRGQLDWDAVNGQLINDGTNDDRSQWLQAPFDSEDADFAVEAEIQLIRHGSEASFGIVTRADDEGAYWLGPSTYYELGEVANIRAGTDSGVPNAGGIGALETAPFRPGSDTHIYRAEVQGNVIRLLIDGRIIVETTDNQYLGGGKVGLWSYQAQITVHGFRVIAL